MNSIGNCLLLNKTFNISKSDQELATFLEVVHEFKNKTMVIDEWASTMTISPAMLRPKSVAFDAISAEIEKREATIKQELVEFIQGKRRRVDLK